MRPVFLRTALMALVLAAPLSAHAADAAPAPVDAKARMEAMSKDNPEAAKLVTMAQDLYNSLTKDEAERLVVVRTGFGMVRVAEMAKDDIGKTVDLCDKSNPSMKKDLDGSFSQFKNKVMPEIATQEKKLQGAVNDKGNFRKPEQVKAFLEQLNKTTVYAKAKNDKDMVRVTTPEACGDLGKSMDKNGDAIVAALQKIEWPSAPAQSPASSPAGKTE